MGHKSIDLAPANVRREDIKLAEDVRDHDEIPADHYWTVVYGHYEADIRETGNDHRFRHYHPWVDREFHDLTPVPITSEPPHPPPSISTHSAAVPEPGGAVLLGIALVIATVAILCRR